MQKFGLFVLKLMGWKLVGQLPPDKKVLVVVAPHTSNWDFVIGLFGRFGTGYKINFLAKSQLFFFPFGLFFRAVGGAPVDRSKKNKQVDKVVELYRKNDEFRLAITPEGTRSAVSRWKQGFYHIATAAQVPIVMIGLDYPSKEIRIREPFYTSGNIEKDFTEILNFFRTIRGCYPKTIPDYQAIDTDFKKKQ